MGNLVNVNYSFISKPKFSTFLNWSKIKRKPINQLSASPALTTTTSSLCMNTLSTNKISLWFFSFWVMGIFIQRYDAVRLRKKIFPGYLDKSVRLFTVFTHIKSSIEISNLKTFFSIIRWILKLLIFAILLGWQLVKHFVAVLSTWPPKFWTPRTTHKRPMFGHLELSSMKWSMQRCHLKERGHQQCFKRLRYQNLSVIFILETQHKTWYQIW